MNFDDLIADFKANENKEVALLVMEDASLRKILAVWPIVDITPLPGPLPQGERECGGWEDLWKVVRFSEETVADLAGISIGPCKQLLRRAIGLRLIYPDGSLHGLARMAMQKRIKDALTG